MGADATWGDRVDRGRARSDFSTVGRSTAAKPKGVPARPRRESRWRADNRCAQSPRSPSEVSAGCFHTHSRPALARRAQITRRSRADHAQITRRLRWSLAPLTTNGPLGLETALLLRARLGGVRRPSPRGRRAFLPPPAAQGSWCRATFRSRRVRSAAASGDTRNNRG